MLTNELRLVLKFLNRKKKKQTWVSEVFATSTGLMHAWDGEIKSFRSDKVNAPENAMLLCLLLM